MLLSQSLLKFSEETVSDDSKYTVKGMNGLIFLHLEKHTHHFYSFIVLHSSRELPICLDNQTAQIIRKHDVGQPYLSIYL